MSFETFAPVGGNLLCERAKEREQKTSSDLVIPQRDGSAKRVRGQTPRAIELKIVKIGNGYGLDESQKEMLSFFKVGDRIAVGNAMILPIYLNGKEYIILDSAHVEGVVETSSNINDMV